MGWGWRDRKGREGGTQRGPKPTGSLSQDLRVSAQEQKKAVHFSSLGALDPQHANCSPPRRPAAPCQRGGEREREGQVPAWPRSSARPRDGVSREQGCPTAGPTAGSTPPPPPPRGPRAPFPTGSSGHLSEGVISWQAPGTPPGSRLHRCLSSLQSGARKQEYSASMPAPPAAPGAAAVRASAGVPSSALRPLCYSPPRSSQLRGPRRGWPAGRDRGSRRSRWRRRWGGARSKVRPGALRAPALRREAAQGGWG